VFANAKGHFLPELRSALQLDAPPPCNGWENELAAKPPARRTLRLIGLL